MFTVEGFTFHVAPSGKTLSVRVMKDERSRSRGFGFVNYVNHEDAQKVQLPSCSSGRSVRTQHLLYLIRLISYYLSG